jgi:outer membrane protein OmpA-like peptidoglycan-associated protein
LACAAALALLAVDAAYAQDTNVQTRCGVNWLPAFTFESNSEFPDRKVVTLLADVVRLARWCRFGSLRVVVYPDDNSDPSVKLARDRAETIKSMLAGPSWPAGKITTAIGAGDAAPTGMQFDKSFRVQATIIYAEPDLKWRTPHLTPTIECKVIDGKSACSQAPPATAQWVREPWPSLGIHMPMIFFHAESSELDRDAELVTGEAARRFLAANCRLLPVTAFADTAEADPIALSIRRALAARDELVKDGVDSTAITIHALGDTELLVPTGSDKSEPQNRRASFDCVD